MDWSEHESNKRRKNNANTILIKYYKISPVYMFICNSSQRNNNGFSFKCLCTIYITWVWQYTRNEQIISTTYPHRGSQNKKRGSDIYTKGDNQNDRERERKEVKENQSYLQIVKLSTVWTFDNVRVKKRWYIKIYIKCVFWNIKTSLQHN